MQVSGQADTYTDTARSPKSAPDGRSQPRTLLVDRTAVHPVRSGIMAAERRNSITIFELDDHTAERLESIDHPVFRDTKHTRDTQ